jgi:signal transduction histidine kinase
VKSSFIVSITDTGTGMTPEQIENLFHLDKPQTRRGTAGEEGSGLGLIVCKELLSMHGSTLHVESREGKGSRFWFSVGGVSV